MGLGASGNGNFDASDGCIITGIFQSNTIAHKSRDESIIVKEKGNTATIRQVLYGCCHQLTRAVLMQAHRKTSYKPKTLSHSQRHITQVVTSVISLRGGAADHGLLHIVRAIQLDPQTSQQFHRLIRSDAPRDAVGGIIRVKDLVDAPQAVGINSILPTGDGMGKPQSLYCFAQGARSNTSSVVCPYHHLLGGWN